MHNASRKWLVKLLDKGSLAVSGVPRVAKAEISHINSKHPKNSIKS